MRLSSWLALGLDPVHMFEQQKLAADKWQADVLRSRETQVILNCSRQSGKSTTVAALALHVTLLRPDALVLLVAPSERQSHELLRKVVAGYLAMGQPLRTRRMSQSEIEFVNGSRVLALPGREETVRSFSGVKLLIIDEAARVPDDLYRSVRPMLAVSRGRLIALSTPFGKRGWFHNEWHGKGPWKRFRIPWTSCPRIDAAFIDEENRALGQGWVDQEYNCMFTALEGLVYPTFESCVYDPNKEVPPGESVKKLGGIDFGWKNPFAAVWGVLDRDNVLWIESERYAKETLIEDHLSVMPREVKWFADPAGRSEIEQLHRRDYTVKAAKNDIRRGIALVNARLRTGCLRVSANCANLIKEAALYRYPTENEERSSHEIPLDSHNHALAALRYLIMSIEHETPRTTPDCEPGPPGSVQSPIDNDHLWQTFD